jgi:HSP20 family molecular chaperone IbpA
MKLIKQTNPLEYIERSLNDFLNLTPVFHSLEEVYKTGDQVRFNQSESNMTIQVDLPGVLPENLDLTTDTQQRDVYIKASREVISHDGVREQTYNRSFSIGREFDIDKIKFKYNNGVLEVTVPRRSREEHIRKHKL